MAIQYERIMKINYGYRLDDIDFCKLVGLLAKKDMFVCGLYDNYSENRYGFTQSNKVRQEYNIKSSTHGLIMTVNYLGDAQRIIDGFTDIIPHITMETIDTESKKKKWMEPEGSYVALPQDNHTFVGDCLNLNCWGENGLQYDNGVTMTIRVKNDYEGLMLNFFINWNVDSIQRKDKIEAAMVQTTMEDMGQIQAIFEGRLKLKQFNYETEHVQIDCHFNAKTESKSECAPDIIKQVRDARQNKG